MTDSCPEYVRCCICCVTGHMASDCLLWWSRRSSCPAPLPHPMQQPSQLSTVSNQSWILNLLWYLPNSFRSQGPLINQLNLPNWLLSLINLHIIFNNLRTPRVNHRHSSPTQLSQQISESSGVGFLFFRSAFAAFWSAMTTFLEFFCALQARYRLPVYTPVLMRLSDTIPLSSYFCTTRKTITFAKSSPWVIN